MQLQLPRCPTLKRDLAWWRGVGAADCGHHTGVLSGCWEHSADSHLMHKLSRTEAFLSKRIVIFTGFSQTSTGSCGTRSDTPSVSQTTPPALLGLFHSASEKNLIVAGEFFMSGTAQASSQRSSRITSGNTLFLFTFILNTLIWSSIGVFHSRLLLHKCLLCVLCENAFLCLHLYLTEMNF